MKNKHSKKQEQIYSYILKIYDLIGLLSGHLFPNNLLFLSISSLRLHRYSSFLYSLLLI